MVSVHHIDIGKPGMLCMIATRLFPPQAVLEVETSSTLTAPSMAAVAAPSLLPDICGTILPRTYSAFDLLSEF